MANLRSMQTITLPAFNDLLNRYPTLVPAKLHELDAQRYKTIPDILAGRKEEGNAFLKKSEVEQLVEWKLRHGTFRPNLLKLVQSNPPSSIEDTTRAAFQLAKAMQEARNTKGVLDLVKARQLVCDAIKTLAKLKGIGPATASVLLSVCDLTVVPFFSDELYAWAALGEPGAEREKKWGIKYTIKEYEVLFERAQGLRERLGVRTVDMEKVAWVMGKEGVVKEGADGGDEVQAGVNAESTEDKGVGNENKEVKAEFTEEKEDGKGKTDVVEAEKQEESKTTTKESKKPKQEPPSKKVAKRKTEDEKPAAENLRRSTRRKTGN